MSSLKDFALSSNTKMETSYIHWPPLNLIPPGVVSGTQLWWRYRQVAGHVYRGGCTQLEEVGGQIIVKLTLVKWIPPKEVVNKKGCILPRDGLYSFGVGLSPSPKSGEILVIRTRGFESWVMILGWIYGISIYLKELIEPISIQNLGCTNCCWNVIRNQQSNGTVVLTGYNQPLIQWFNCAKDREYSLPSLVIFWDLGSTMLRVS